MTSTNRRDFVRLSLQSGLFLGFSSLAERVAFGWPIATQSLGPLQPTPAEGTGELILALPPNFRYAVLTRAGKPMTDGNLTPIFPDGMAAFQDGGSIRITRNHEIPNPGARISFSDRFYDQSGAGGVTTLIVDPATRRVVSDFVSLSGTARNCSGGRTPWGTWISCEETTVGPKSGFQRPHGYCFEVSASADGPVSMNPLTAMGRFFHEAVAVDPTTGIVYLTEDQFEAGFYRFLPNRPRELAAGGRLQMLAVSGRPQYDTRTRQVPRTRLPVEWIDIPNPDPPEAEDFPSWVYASGKARGGAIFTRLEGATHFSGSIIFTSTSGGTAGLGQVWQYRYDSRRRLVRGSPKPDVLTLLYESASVGVLKAPDNLCVGPGGALVLCEDSPVGDQHLRVLTPSGSITDLARNITRGAEGVEFAGATFSPDGETLFVNLLQLGYTLAIWGPWSLLDEID